MEWRGGRDGGSRRRRIEGRGDHGKLECIGMEFSRPEGRELRMGWRDTDHPPLLDTHAHAHTHTHTPQPVSGEGGKGQCEWARDLRPRDGVCKDQRAGGQKWCSIPSSRCVPEQALPPPRGYGRLSR